MSKIILFISAFVPMYALFLINLIVELINENLTFNVTNTLVLLTLISLIIIGVVGVLLIINTKSEYIKKVSIVSKKNLTDQHFLNYYSLFVLLALTFDLSKICFICVLILTMIFIGVVYVRNNIFYINPLLNIMGYSFYDVTYKDEEGNDGEIRIFYKGEIKLKNEKYKLNLSVKNLNFLEKSE